jgi:hypothetical protein
MKHLKTFESMINDDLSNLKKYILWNGSDNNLYIFKTGKPYVATWGPPLNYCEVFPKYMYDKREKRLDKEESTGEHSIGSNRKDLIIYQSDNIQDCIDMIYSMEISPKYNL